MKGKLILSVLRTMVALVLLGTGVVGMFFGGAWPAWCPDNGIGTISVLLVYLVSILLIIYGIYQVSPVFWKKIEPVVFERWFNIKTDWEVYEKEMNQLTEFYIW